DGDQGARTRDRTKAAALARRAARGDRDAVLLARPDQRDDHEPSRGASAGTRARRAARRRNPVLKVCYFGTYERGYPRNSQVISCLRGAGVEVLEEHVSVWNGERHGWGAGSGRALRLAAAEAQLLARRPPDDVRSEEHTSELQSRGHLVCRLLLE